MTESSSPVNQEMMSPEHPLAETVPDQGTSIFTVPTDKIPFDHLEPVWSDVDKTVCSCTRTMFFIVHKCLKQVMQTFLDLLRQESTDSDLHIGSCHGSQVLINRMTDPSYFDQDGAKCRELLMQADFVNVPDDEQVPDLQNILKGLHVATVFNVDDHTWIPKVLRMNEDEKNGSLEVKTLTTAVDVGTDQFDSSLKTLVGLIPETCRPSVNFVGGLAADFQMPPDSNSTVIGMALLAGYTLKEQAQLNDVRLKCMRWHVDQHALEKKGLFLQGRVGIAEH